ncbi:unnamed protein product [Echinostoma caproni]|uniref:Reverse transcriptase domain-containing protein n=1 Tax=Echinostoma caproni TaxID=27848 RepID=A0A183AVA9_9TREM|nr:unnamed protein product [Echinostoma caproni]
MLENQIDLGIPLSVLEHLLVLCTTDVYFSFRGRRFRQVDGVAMGSPLGPILADIFMASLEKKASRTLDGTILYKDTSTTR